MVGRMLQSRAGIQKLIVYAVDVTVISAALPAAYWLTGSTWQFGTWPLLLLWLAMVGAMVGLFQAFRVYSSLWRFASTRDFVNIALAALTGLLLMLCALSLSAFLGVVPLFDFQTLTAFCLLVTVGVGATRLVYRIASDATALRRHRPVDPTTEERSIFIGTLADASLVARELSRGHRDLPPLAAIFATDCLDARSQLANIPVHTFDAVDRLAFQGSTPAAIVGRRGFEGSAARIDIIQRMRARRARVLEFVGVSELANEPNTNGHQGFADIDIASIIQRGETEIDRDDLERAVHGKRVLITGGAGSIGRHLATRCLTLGAAQVTVVDRWEAGMFGLVNEFATQFGAQFRGHVADICDTAAMNRIFRTERPQIVFHAAAMKHVPIAEHSWASAVHVNMVGTLATARLARDSGVEQFVFISTDKAVDPSTFLGWTKRFGEIVCASMTRHSDDGERRTRFMATRFGNVFASAGSVVEVFNAQIQSGRPVTVTDPRMKRYFMTGQEASDLVILAAARDAERGGASSGIYALEMGEQVSILELAHSLIRLAGKEPCVDVHIDVIGIRANEKLEESLVSSSERPLTVLDDGVIEIAAPRVSEATLDGALDELNRIASSGSRDDVIALVQSLEEQAQDGAKIVPIQDARARRQGAAAAAD